MAALHAKCPTGHSGAQRKSESQLRVRTIKLPLHPRLRTDHGEKGGSRRR
jgi:hypothetical protein